MFLGHAECSMEVQCVVYALCTRRNKPNTLGVTELYANQHILNTRTFISVDCCLWEPGKYCTSGMLAVNGNGVLAQQTMKKTLTCGKWSHTSIRRVVAAVDTSPVCVCVKLWEHQLYPYHKQSIQALQQGNAKQRVEFCHWILNKCTDDPVFSLLVLFTDEVCFTHNTVFNTHMYTWAIQNPHDVQATQQQQISIIIWIAIVGDHFINPHMLPAWIMAIST